MASNTTYFVPRPGQWYGLPSTMHHCASQCHKPPAFIALLAGVWSVWWCSLKTTCTMWQKASDIFRTGCAFIQQLFRMSIDLVAGRTEFADGIHILLARGVMSYCYLKNEGVGLKLHRLQDMKMCWGRRGGVGHPRPTDVKYLGGAALLPPPILSSTACCCGSCLKISNVPCGGGNKANHCFFGGVLV